MTVLNLVDAKDPILHTPVEPFDPQSVDLEQIVADMFETMYHYKGVGLSANQVGLPYRLFVMGTPEMELVFINPTITSYNEEKVYAEEGCLSYPHTWVKVKRPTEVRVRSTNMHGDTSAQLYKGMTARIIQHEYDHLQGETHLSKATRYHRDQALRKANRLRKRSNLALNQVG